MSDNMTGSAGGQYIAYDTRAQAEIDRLTAENESLRRELAEAREALRPWAEAAVDYTGWPASELIGHFKPHDRDAPPFLASRFFTVGDLRRAARAMGGETK